MFQLSELTELWMSRYSDTSTLDFWGEGGEMRRMSAF